jgi:GDP-mannose 6-dehydrogenase
LARIFGANKEYIEREIPHISSLMHRRVEEVIEGSEVVVVTKRSDEVRAAVEAMPPGPIIIDLTRIVEGWRSDEHYRGIGW